MKNQTLSQLLDGELNSDEMEAALDNILADPELQKSWHTLHTLRSVIRDDSTNASCNIVDRVAEALHNEPAIVAPDNIKPKNPTFHQSGENVVQIGAWRNKALSYAAIAASFAAIVMVSYSPEKTEAPAIADSAIKVAPSQALEQEFQSMVVQHGEFSGAAALNGLVAYAKVVNGSTGGETR